MENAKQTISNIASNLSQRSASRKDEITVMRAIINDPSYTVADFKKDGTIEAYYPGQSFRKTVSNIVADITHMPKKEATELVDNYEFSRADAESLVDLSKEFVQSYLQTGRKLPLGGRITSNIELMWKKISERSAVIPNKDPNKRESVTIPAHEGIRVINQCPDWVRK